MTEKRKEDLVDETQSLIHYGVLLTALLLAGVTWWVTRDPTNPPKIPKPSIYEGKVLDAPITLITADKWDLACASANEVQGFHCQYKDEKTPWPGVDARNPTSRKKMLAPYMTVDDTLFLIPGLFEEPAIADRYRDELPFGKSRKSLQRFTARCKLKVLKKLPANRVRWNRNAAWSAPEDRWVGTVSHCQISEP